jgi:hypothetical protein
LREGRVVFYIVFVSASYPSTWGSGNKHAPTLPSNCISWCEPELPGWTRKERKEDANNSRLVHDIRPTIGTNWNIKIKAAGLGCIVV